jgi:hypothetical protein
MLGGMLGCKVAVGYIKKQAIELNQAQGSPAQPGRARANPSNSIRQPKQQHPPPQPALATTETEHSSAEMSHGPTVSEERRCRMASKGTK